MRTPTLGRRAAFWTGATTAGLALWTSAAPSVVYPLYARDWHLTPAVTTAVFAVYPLVLVLVLLFFGDLGDAIGRRGAIVSGLTASALGTLLFALAPGVGVVLTGRALMGVGVGLSLSAATALMAESAAPEKRSRTGAITTASTAGGLTVATLLGGALASHAPDPLHLGFLVLLAALVLGIVLAALLPRGVRRAQRWRPRLLAVPRGLRPVIVTAALAVSTAYMLGAVVLSLGADLVTQLLGSRADPFVSGVVLAVSSVAIAVVAIATRALRPHVALPVGAAATIAGLALLLAASAAQSLPLVLAGMLVGGAGYSLEFAGGIGIAATRAPAEHRVGVVSAVYLVAYAAQGGTALVLGAVATALGLTTAFAVAVPVVAAVAVVGAIAVTVRPRATGAGPQGEPA